MKNRDEVIAKMNWEGGIYDALEYGLKASDMPDEELKEAWQALEDAFSEAEYLADRVLSLLEGGE